MEHDEREVSNQILAEMGRLWKERENPLYLWQAIHHCYAWDIPFPEWTRPYFGMVSMSLMHLVDRSGVDIGLGTLSAPIKPYREGKDLKPGDALDGVPWALMLAGEKGASAFSRLASDIKHNQDLGAVTFSSMMKGKQGVSEVRDVIAKRRGIAGDGDPARSVRRRVAKARVIAGTKTPPDKRKG